MIDVEASSPWEHAVLDFHAGIGLNDHAKDDAFIEDVLDDYGEQGWALVGITTIGTTTRVVMRRPLMETEALERQAARREPGTRRGLGGRNSRIEPPRFDEGQ